MIHFYILENFIYTYVYKMKNKYPDYLFSPLRIKDLIKDF